MSEPGEPATVDPFAQAAAEKPGCKLARVVDQTLGMEFIIALAPGSKYFDLALDRQTIEIKRTPAQPAAEPASAAA